VPLIGGRSFDDHDTATGEPVVLISRPIRRIDPLEALKVES
jgi:hypothetical protein